MNLKTRWDNSEKVDSIKNYLKNAKSNLLEKTTDGKYDLRGFDFKKNEIRFIRNIVFENIDFSNCNFENVEFSKVTFRNCLFIDVKFILSRFEVCFVEDCKFQKAKFSYFIIENIGDNCGWVKNSNFIESKLHNFKSLFPIIDNCSFENCDFLKCDFDGSRLSNCKFIGDIKNLVIGGITYGFHDPFWRFFRRFDPKKNIDKYSNKMINIDFAEANMFGVFFQNDVDITNCKFPKGEIYFEVYNIEKTYYSIRESVEKEWESITKSEALFLLDNYFFKRTKFGMKKDFWCTIPNPEIQYVTIQSDLLKYIKKHL